MKKMRAINGFFESSTQGMAKLLQFQRDSNYKIYKDQPLPKKTLQDVETRWWSTFRSLRRLRFLKKAIRALIASEEVSCKDLTDDEWKILHQVEITLEPMAEFQRILEGESYVTGSLVPVAVYQIRKSYQQVIECADTEATVVDLTKLLLDDFDKRYVPADASGKVKYYQTDEIGAGNRHVGIHQFFFIAALIDPRIAPLLRTLMTANDYTELKDDVAELMIAKMKASKPNGNNHATETPATPTSAATSTPTTSQAKRARKMGAMFHGLDTRAQNVANVARDDADDNSDEDLRRICKEELERYLLNANKGCCPLETENNTFNDPMIWWKANEGKYAYVAVLAKKYLAIPATSAPSERIWSRASRILSLRRARLNDDIVSRIMYTKENLRFLHKHYVTLAKKEADDSLHKMLELDVKYLPPIDDEGGRGRGRWMLGNMTIC